MEEKKIQKPKDEILGINPFRAPAQGLPVPYETKDTEDDKYIIERAMVDVVEKTGEGPKDFIVKQELQEISRKSRKDFIESFRGDVGILNVIKKVQLTGDATLLNQRQVELGDADITDMPTDKIEAMDAVNKGVEAFDNLPDDIKKKMSFKQFAEQNKEELDALINAKVQELLNAQKAQESQKEGDK